MVLTRPPSGTVPSPGDGSVDSLAQGTSLRYLEHVNPPSSHQTFDLAWVDGLAPQGRITFTTDEARAAHGGSAKAVQAVLRRLRAKKEIATPLRGFQVVLPPEYRRLGCLPPLWFVDDLSAFLGLPYYVALLSAAELHGAAHQRPQAFQVMLPRPQRPVACGDVRIDFAQRSNLEHAPTLTRNTPKGIVRVATPELTAFDLVGYPQHAGGLGNTATILVELADELDPRALADVAEICPLPWAQRLGFLLDLVGANDKSEALAEWVSERSPAFCTLDPAGLAGEHPRDARWKLVVNTTVEPDQ